MNADRVEGPPDQRTLRLPEGRRLGFAEYGAPDGRPVFGIFGAAARRLRPPDGVTVRAGVRLILLERPGFGLSDPVPRRTLLDWPAEVLALAGALGLDKFAVVGGSEGGPFGAACAYQIPERLSAVALVSALGATLRGAVIWRGTRYALGDLRAGNVREADWPSDRAPG